MGGVDQVYMFKLVNYVTLLLKSLQSFLISCAVKSQILSTACFVLHDLSLSYLSGLIFASLSLLILFQPYHPYCWFTKYTQLCSFLALFPEYLLLPVQRALPSTILTCPSQRLLYQRGPSLLSPKIQHPFLFTRIILYTSYHALFLQHYHLVLYNYYVHFWIPSLE